VVTRGATNAWVKQTRYFFFLFPFSWDFYRWMIHLCKLEFLKIRDWFWCLFHRETFKFLTYRHPILDHTIRMKWVLDCKSIVGTWCCAETCFPHAGLLYGAYNDTLPWVLTVKKYTPSISKILEDMRMFWPPFVCKHWESNYELLESSFKHQGK
jgi:hypothetical protein